MPSVLNTQQRGSGVMKLDPGQGRTRWALEQTVASLERHLPAMKPERASEATRKIKAIRKALA